MATNSQTHDRVSHMGTNKKQIMLDKLLVSLTFVAVPAMMRIVLCPKAGFMQGEKGQLLTNSVNRRIITADSIIRSQKGGVENVDA